MPTKSRPCAEMLASQASAGHGRLVPVTATVSLLSHGTVVSRWNDRRGAWVPLPGFEPKLGEGYELIWGPSDTDAKGEMHLRYKFPGGAVVTQERLYAELDKARANGEPSIDLDSLDSLD